MTNLWVNRLIGDAGLPEGQRLTKTNIGLQSGPFEKVYEGYSSQGSAGRVRSSRAGAAGIRSTARATVHRGSPATSASSVMIWKGEFS